MIKVTDFDRKVFDFLLADGDWEKTQRIQLYRKLGKVLDKVSSKDTDKRLKEIKRLLKK